MLKIKDDIDLEVLEKYGFRYDFGYYHKTICEGRRGQYFEIEIYQDREICGYSYGADGDGETAFIDDTIYDLIKDGLVEKV